MGRAIFAAATTSYGSPTTFFGMPCDAEKKADLTVFSVSDALSNRQKRWVFVLCLGDYFHNGNGTKLMSNIRSPQKLRELISQLQEALETVPEPDGYMFNVLSLAEELAVVVETLLNEAQRLHNSDLLPIVKHRRTAGLLIDSNTFPSEVDNG